MTNKILTAQAEARFKAKAERALDAPIARAEYDAAQIATREKTARLRALRLARNEEDSVQQVAPAVPTRRKAAAGRTGSKTSASKSSRIKASVS